MRTHNIGELPQPHKWFRNQLERRALVLLYHRVAEVDTDPWSMCVSRKHFAEHLEVLRRHARPVGLGELVSGLRDGQLPSKTVAVTFDDGYADNLYNAKPLLDRHDIRATVFLTTGYIGREREFWWDELEKLLLLPGTLPETLRLDVNGNTYHWELSDAANYSEDAFQRDRFWHVGQKTDPSRRHTLYRSLYALLRPLAEAHRRKVQDALLAWAGVNPAARPTHRTLSSHEVIRLAEGNLVEVGAHTVTHPILPLLPVPAQRSEIQESKRYLEDLLERPVNTFSYPHGSHTAETLALVREVGFDCACSVVPNAVVVDSKLHELPRFGILNWNGGEFDRQLYQWFRG